MLPNSVTVGEKSSSSAIVAALMNFIVIIGVRKTAISAASAIASRFRRQVEAARDDDAGDLLLAEGAKSRLPLTRRQALEIGLLRRAEHLYPFLREIRRRTRPARARGD